MSASGKKRELYAAAVIDSDTTTVSDSVQMHGRDENVFAVMTVSSRTDGTFTTTIQHSPDNANWVTLKAGSATSADGIDVMIIPATGYLTYVRASILSASTTDGATIKVELFSKTPNS